MMDCRLVPPSLWHLIREEVWPFYVSSIAASSDDWSPEDAERAFLSGQHLLYVVYNDGKIVTIAQGQFVYYPKQTVFLVLLAAGKIQAYDEALNKLCQLVRAGGATHLEAWCRPSMERFLRRFGFIKRHSVVRKSI